MYLVHTYVIFMTVTHVIIDLCICSNIEQNPDILASDELVQVYETVSDVYMYVTN